MKALSLSIAFAAVLGASSLAHAARVLVVSDSGADTNIGTALMADGHMVTTVSSDFAAGDNPTLRGSLAAYDVIFWSASGEGSGDTHSDARVFTNLTAFVMAGGYVFVTGYDSIASPADPMLIAFLGGGGSVDVPDEPNPIMMISNALTEGVVDIRGRTITDSPGDMDALTGLRADTVAVVTSMGAAGEVQWSLRSLGSGFIAYVANGDGGAELPASWTSPTSAYNGAIRNFAFAVDSGLLGPCMGLMEGAACTTPMGATGLCRSMRCCTGCWDGARCRAGDTAAICGAGGAACASCDDGMFCTLDECSATGTCSSAVSPAVCDDEMVCTTDTCDEAMDRCSYEVSGGCVVDGRCFADGDANPRNPCEACDAETSGSAFTARPVGDRCSPSVCTLGRIRRNTCDAAGMCITSPPIDCESGACVDSTACVDRCMEGGCPEGEYCNPVSMRCITLASNGDRCADDSTCLSGMCADGVCCDAVCDGTCSRCDLAGSIGACMPIPEGADPDEECDMACDGAGGCMMPDAGGLPDAGASDSGASIDGGARRDAGSTEGREDDGCGCSTTSPSGAWLFALALLALARRRR
jgi:MYXO-CTERM domain-containing protein